MTKTSGRSLSTMTGQPCVFCQIAQGLVPAHLVFEDEASLAFLDYRPVFPGHTLLVPRAYYQTLADPPADFTGPLFSNAQLLAKAVEQGLEAEGTFVAINHRVSQSVPHLHVHIVPRRRGDGLRGFFWPRQRYESEASMRGVQEAIRSAVSIMRS